MLPRGVRAGHVKITGMKGESPIESPPTTAQKPKVDAAPTPSQLPAIEHESTSQDGSDFISTSKPGKKIILSCFFCIFLFCIINPSHLTHS